MDQVSSDNAYNVKRILGGRRLVDVPLSEKLVISGISGYFPNSNNVQIFMENLLNKVDLCDDDERRWIHSDEEIPKISGKIYNAEKFDLGFFGISNLAANWMDPSGRMLLERTVEAIMDAGINPEELKGTNTGVYIGACHAEVELRSLFNPKVRQTNAIAGCTRSMLAHRISYALQLNGPSVICDTACSSGLYAFEVAYRAILEGKCEMAIVAASNLCLNPQATLQFARLGVLNKNSGCRPFDRDGNGYTRSEGIVVMILQKEKNSRRVYAKIVHAKVNSDGFKEHGITYPSGQDQFQLLKDVYEECRVDPTSIAYVEAHGTGTKVGDPEELTAIDRFFCTNRDRPLLIGSVKGNIGHSEPASGLCSLIKVLYGMNFEYIPPNIHYDNPRPDIPALMDKRLSVVVEKTKWPEFSRLAGINCFGFGGANCHVVLEKFDKKKEINLDDVPRLVCFSGRTKHSLEVIQEYLRNNALDYEFIRLIQESYRKCIRNHIYRGFSILLPNKEIEKSGKQFSGEKYSLYLCLGNENIQSSGVLKELDKLQPFKETYKRCLRVLQKNNIKMQLKEDEPNNPLQKALITIIAHIGIIDIFDALGINFDYFRGCSMGEFTAAYANGSLDLEQAIMASYTISRHFIESQNTDMSVFETLLIKLQSIINSKSVKLNRIQIPTFNKYTYGSPEYFLFNILNPTIVSDTYKPFTSNAIIVNVDFNCNMKESVRNLALWNTDFKVENLLTCIGRLYELGYNSSVDKLFPEIQWPVSAGTAMFSHLVKWNHSMNLFLPNNGYNLVKKINEKQCCISGMSSESSFYKGHVIDGRTLFPATGYIFLVWQFFAEIFRENQECIRIGFENIKFLRATTFSKDGILLSISINKEGYFEIVDGNVPVVTGRIYFTEKFNDLPKPGGATREEIPLTQKDIYKELRLRGYHYKGAFKAIHQMVGNEALINWNLNWIPFLDNLLQLCIITEDTRSLAVPTAIDRLLIDPVNFLTFVDTLDADKLVPCYTNKTISAIYTKGIQIFGLRASTIPRKRVIYKPVLETYKFVPNNMKTNIHNSMRINMQMILENKQVTNMKILEVINRESDIIQPLCPEIVKVLEDFPLILPEITVFSSTKLDIEMKGIQLETNKISHDHSNLIYIGSHLLQNEKDMQIAKSSIDTDGFIITIESTDVLSKNTDFNILTTHQINGKFIFLLKQLLSQPNTPSVIDVSNLDKIDNWLDHLKLNCRSASRVILYAQNNDISGILGLANCIRREPNGEKVSCFFIRDKAPPFDKNDSFYKNQIDKNMSINIYQEGQWGTFRHLLCNPNAKVKSNHFYGTTALRGDLSSLEWYQGMLNHDYDNLYHIYYSALNFRDVMLASGKLPVEAITSNRLAQEFVIGFEFSGRDKNGNRIMGIAECGSNSNLVQAKNIWKIPNYWSLEDAATIPVVYLTVLKAFEEANLKPGQSILIHSGTGGIGQAALNVCAHYNCNVFTTVGTQEKKEYLLNNYPYLKSTHVGNSRNTTFEEMIYRETNGRGVDIVLNSLAEDKLHASVRCLAKGGYFLEIGKYDLSNDTRISTDLLQKGCTYQGIMLDASFNDDNLIIFFQSLLDKSMIKPLNRTVFEIDQLEDAFRYMTTGKHMGKVLIKLRTEEKEDIVHPAEITHYAIPRFYCDPGLSYIILGGLGGFGLELADWLMLRGAKNLILSSRNGITTGYQQSRIRNFTKNGVKATILTDDISTYEGCKNLLIKANSLAPIGGIFNLAVELRDALLENLSTQDFHASLCPKAYATTYLDKLSRDLCPKLHQFVVFSSVSCGRGNAGQCNYGMSNSIMERICELRRSEGFPALAIQWGAIGDVGLVAEMQKDATEIAIGGTLQQRISSCLDVLDKFLKQDEPVVSSMVVAEKFVSNNADNLVDAVLCLLGVSDIKTISLHSTLAELGMDSMMAIEIKQTLERDYDVFLSVQDMRTLTIARLQEINESRGDGLATLEEATFDISKFLGSNFFHENNYHMATVETAFSTGNSKVLLLPGIEGSYNSMQPLINSFKFSSTCIQYKMIESQKTFEDFIQHYYLLVRKILDDTKTFNIVAHSFGGVLALEIASRLEEDGYVGKIVLVDSSPEYMMELLSTISTNFDKDFEIKFLLRLIGSYMPANKLVEIAEQLRIAESTAVRKEIAFATIPEVSDAPKQYLYELGQSIFSIILSFIKYDHCIGKKLKSNILLCKPSIPAVRNIPDDYHLSNYTENMELATFEGDHLTVLENKELHERIVEYFAL